MIFGRRKYNPQDEIERIKIAITKSDTVVRWLSFPETTHFKSAYMGEIGRLTQDVHSLALEAVKNAEEIKFKRNLAECLGRIWTALEATVADRERLQEELDHRSMTMSQTKEVD